MNELQRHLERLTAFIDSTQPSLSWSSILMAEDTDVTHGNVSIVSCSALTTPEKYAERFEEHLNSGYAWINMNAASVKDGTLLVVIELPEHPNAVPIEKVSVNLSGPSTHTLDHLKIIDGKSSTTSTAT